MLTIQKKNLSLILIFISIGINDFFIMSYLTKIFGTEIFLWPLRYLILIMIFFLNKNNLRFYISKRNYPLIVFFFASIIFGTIISTLSIGLLISNIITHFFYISILLFLFQANDLFDEDTFQFIGSILVILGVISALCFLLLDIETIRDPAGKYINLINFPTYGFLGLMILTFKRPYIFIIITILILVVAFYEINRTLVLATIIFYLIIGKKDFGFFKKISYPFLILLTLLITLIIGFFEINILTTQTLSNGRGQIWYINFLSLINSDILSILFGSRINNLDMINQSYEYNYINHSINYFQLHSVIFKTLLDYGIIGFILVLFIFANSNKRSQFNSQLHLYVSLFFFNYIVVILNSSTNFVKYDLYGLILFVALAGSITNIKKSIDN